MSTRAESRAKASKLTSGQRVISWCADTGGGCNASLRAKGRPLPSLTFGYTYLIVTRILSRNLDSSPPYLQAHAFVSEG
ncbi:hypothetical protein EVAR_23122_1 [Eumeta japonica]|uniref:Uncharacterized protein n=1 Tax=Eumeta variegata TaxID=151549 RepID=A0A4C1VB91_EUMVA|nr:hypothetical protein EVAR_23122_1 [Eumeta japonica]